MMNFRMGPSPYKLVFSAILLTALYHPADAQDKPRQIRPRIEPRREQHYTIPLIDLAGETHRQIIVEKTPGQYLGHTTTVLMPDGKTLFCTYPLGHGGPAAVLKQSRDGGLSWSKRLQVPENWSTATNCPSIHRVVDPHGVERLIIMEGNGAMRQSLSMDHGQTWTPFQPNGLTCTVAPNTLVPLSGNRYLAHFAREDGDAQHIQIFQSVTEDGGVSWQPQRLIVDVDGVAPDEPGTFLSPDGTRIVSLLRENRRRANSLYIYSDNEGKTWSVPQELPAALTGDRHMPRYARDGRLVVTFRDMAGESPTHGDWVAWVGCYEDLFKGTEGQYRIRLMKNHHDFDCAYAGLELLPDNTFVATTYGHWTKGKKPYIVSVRFTLEEIDQRTVMLTPNP